MDLIKRPVVGLFDSGIGGFSILEELLKIFQEAHYLYYSDDAHAPYGPKSDEYITERSFKIVDELLKKGAEIIVVACNTATAASIDALRIHYPDIDFVGVEPYLNAYYKEKNASKMVVLVTESMGKSERFKRLRERLDPQGMIDYVPLKNLARMVEQLYYDPSYEKAFDAELIAELSFLQGKNYGHAILGCTHYPLVRDKIEKVLNLKTLRPCPYVAERAKELSLKKWGDKKRIAATPETTSKTFEFFSSKKTEWVEKERETFLGPFKK